MAYHYGKKLEDYWNISYSTKYSWE